MKISVIGCGYLGAFHAATLASMGHTVVGIDVDSHKVEQLNKSLAPFHEPGLDELLSDGRTTGRLKFTTDFSAAADAKVHFLCVGTPQSKTSDTADLSYLMSATVSSADKIGALRPIGNERRSSRRPASSSPRVSRPVISRLMSPTVTRPNAPI